jgi:hypothetical protein
MNRLLTILLAVSLVCASLMTANAWRRACSEPHFRGRPLSDGATVLAVEPGQNWTLVREIGPAITPFLVHEIERFSPIGQCLDELRFRLYYSIAPLIAKVIPDPTLRAERRMGAIQLLGQLGPQAVGAMPTLIQLLDDETVVGSVMTTLGEIGPGAKTAVPKLIELLEQESPRAATALGKIGPEAIPALTRALTSDSLSHQLEAAVALARIRPSPATVVQASKAAN